MNTSSRTDEPVAPNAELLIIDLLQRHLPTVPWRELHSAPHRLSAGALQERIDSLRGLSDDQIRSALVGILTELDLYRLGFDEGFEARDITTNEVRAECEADR